MTMRTPQNRANIGDVCSVMLKFLHPSRLISDRYPNQDHRERLDNLLVTGEEIKQIRGQNRNCITFRHADFENVILYCSVSYAKVTTHAPTPERMPAEVARVEEAVLEEELLQAMPRTTGDAAADIIQLRAEGYGVDDDNDPAPENVPNPNDQARSTEVYSNWGERLPGHCNRRATHNHHEPASIKPGKQPPNNTRLEWFLRCLPMQYLNEVLIPETNKKMNRPMDFPEFLKFIGLLLLMSTTRVGCSIRDWFSEAPPNPFEGAPFRLHQFMSRSRYEEILRSLTYTSSPKPNFKDRFWQVRSLIKAWNENMSTWFCASWVSCLDESMSPWTSRWTCPGWMYVPRKPWPFGNEYHTIACCLSGILWFVELVEGKDQPPEIPKEHDNNGKTVGLLLRMTRPIWSTGKVVILDSGFCVLKGIIELMKKGVFASALIKKRRYWPKDVPGDDIRRAFEGKAIGDTARLPGVAETHYPFDIFAMKEEEYVLMFMSTYGSLLENEDQKLSYRSSSNGQPPISFKYKEVFGNHYKYRGSVDEHNSKRHDGNTGAGMSLEASWTTTRWENRVFSYVLGTSEVNAYLSRSYFASSDHETQFQFRQNLSRELLFYLENRQEDATPRRTRASRSINSHELRKLPPFSKNFGGIPKKMYSRKYQQRKCSTPGCKNRVRTFCKCSPDIIRCRSCFASHCVEAALTP